LLAATSATLIAVSVAAAQQRQRPQPPTPDHANVRYGPHERNVFDVWLATSDKATPLVIYYHGGGFRGGDKRTINLQTLRQLREKGITVAAVNYRLSGTAPFPAQMHDCARALQYIRLHAGDYNIDPNRVGATGGSAGAGISQWLAFHDDLARPGDPDLVRRQSTRLSAVMAYNAQTSYDPRFIKKLMNTDQVDGALLPLFGMKSAADVDNPKYAPLFEEASPINHLPADDPPVMLFYSQKNDPLPPNSPGKLHIHPPNFGPALKEKADRLGVECIVLYREQYPDGHPVERYVGFLVEKLKP
jgi:acetyl esterase/lipase